MPKEIIERFQVSLAFSRTPVQPLVPCSSYSMSETYFQAVIDRPELQGAFKRPEGYFNINQLLVAQGHIFSADRVIRGQQKILAVELFFFFYLGPVKLYRSVFKSF